MRYLVFSDLLNKTFDTMEEAEAAEKAELDRIKKEEESYIFYYSRTNI